MKKEIKNAIEEYKLGKLSLAKIAGKYQIDRNHLSDMLKRENIEIINKSREFSDFFRISFSDIFGGW